MGHDFMNVGKAAAYLGVSAASLRQWSDDGLVTVYRTPGGQRRYRSADLETFMCSMQEDGPLRPVDATPIRVRDLRSFGAA